MMELYSTIMLMQKTSTAIPLWQRLTKLHWLLVDLIQKLIRLKYLIFQATHGPKLLYIHIIHSKLSYSVSDKT